MKKLMIAALLPALIFTACRQRPQDSTQSRPQYYSFYDDFTAPQAERLKTDDARGYTRIDREGRRQSLKDNLGLENLTDHGVYRSGEDMVVNFVFDRQASARQIFTALDYAGDTFWNGEFHTENLLPYEDWQFRDRIKQLTVQIFMEREPIYTRHYSFVQLTDSGEKQRDIEYRENIMLHFDGQQIDIPADDGEDYFGIFDIRGRDCRVKLYQSLDGSTATLCLYTNGQVDDKNLERLKEAVHARTQSISDRLYIELYDTNNSQMYYRY